MSGKPGTEMYIQTLSIIGNVSYNLFNFHFNKIWLIEHNKKNKK